MSPRLGRSSELLACVFVQSSILNRSVWCSNTLALSSSVCVHLRVRVSRAVHGNDSYTLFFFFFQDITKSHEEVTKTCGVGRAECTTETCLYGDKWNVAVVFFFDSQRSRTTKRRKKNRINGTKEKMGWIRRYCSNAKKGGVDPRAAKTWVDFLKAGNKFVEENSGWIGYDGVYVCVPCRTVCVWQVLWPCREEGDGHVLKELRQSPLLLPFSYSDVFVFNIPTYF